MAVVSRRTQDALVLKYDPGSHDPYHTVSVAGALIEAQQVSRTAHLRLGNIIPMARTVCRSRRSDLPWPLAVSCKGDFASLLIPSYTIPRQKASHKGVLYGQLTYPASSGEIDGTGQ